MNSMWRVDAGDEDVDAPGAPDLVSLHFLLMALRRSWRVWLALTLVGLLLGIGWLVYMPVKSVGTTTLLLGHEAGKDPSLAMSTDVSLAQTRAVALNVVEDLRVPMTPEEFQETVLATPETADVMLLEVEAVDDESALARTRTLADEFLRFRATQLSKQAEAAENEYRDRIQTLQQQAQALTKQYEILSEGTAAQQEQGPSILAERSNLHGEITRLQETMEEAAISTEVLLASSGVLDPASVKPFSPLRRTVLVTASGLLAGLVVGMGLVIFLALTSTRLRRRDEIATALGVPVKVTVGRMAPRTRFRRRSVQRRDHAILEHALMDALPYDENPSRLIIACVGDLDEARHITAIVGARLAARGLKTLLVDLGESAGLAKLTKRGRHLGNCKGSVEVLRPDGVALLARGPYGLPAGTRGLGRDDDLRRRAWHRADVVLTFAEVDPAREIGELATWGTRVVFVVTAGLSSAERLQSAAEQVKSAGLDLAFAVLVSTDRVDDSLGVPGAVVAGDETVKQRAVK